MLRNLAVLFILAPSIMFSAGCSMCGSPFDHAYGGYGGVTERYDRFHGRVGSAFAPAGYVEESDVEYDLEDIPPGESQPDEILSI